MDEFAEVLEGALGGGAYLVQECAGGRWVAVQEAGGFVEGHAQGDEAGLCSVVQVSFDAP